MQPKTILRGVLLHDDRTSCGHVVSDELYSDIDLDSFPTMVEATFEGDPVTIYLKLGKPLDRPDYPFFGLQKQKPYRLDQHPLINRALRRGKLIRGSIPARNRGLHVFMLTGVIGDCFVVHPRDHGDYIGEYAECWHHAIELESYVAFDAPNFYFGDINDAALFKIRWQ